MSHIDACPVRNEPFGHQLEKWRLCRDKEAWGHLWEQGTGKSMEIIMQASWLYSRGEIDAVLVLAPNGVHRNWITDEMPKHWPSELGRPSMAYFRADKVDTKRHQEEILSVINSRYFAFLAMSYDSLLQEDRKAKPGKPKVLGGRSLAKMFLTQRRVLIVGDESSRIKSPTAKRTKLALKAAPFAKFRRILNGTPVPNGPFDIYTQIKFLDPEFWMRHGISSFEGFKTQFGEWGTGHCWRPNPKTGQQELHEFPELITYKNLDILNRWLTEISDRVLKEDVLDLPAKLYKRMEFDMVPAQRRVYDQLRDESMAFLSSGELVTTPIVLTRLLRLQQVTCGYVPVDDEIEDPIRDICDDNPRLDLLREIVQDLGHSAIIWVRFKRDADNIMRMLSDMKMPAVRYDGTVKDDDRREAVAAFQQGRAQFFVANPAAAGEGLTLLGDQSDEALSCKTVIYYSNGNNLQQRLQSEDRAHRIGQRWPVQYIDLVASDSVDAKVVANLRDKFDVASQITGDRLREWLS